ncbi:MAG: DUF488 domain-containing protein [Armatimonadota bacterium]|nr:DUF488 domain-containing protein [Armatimonadota bacterium]MDR5704061.1 DUF488 domain-containing protein [Armatimonadota bacterium]MDR7433786.1 DUF488 domain-containing protein [Armatimonadota bacterium]
MTLHLSRSPEPLSPDPSLWLRLGSGRLRHSYEGAGPGGEALRGESKGFRGLVFTAGTSTRSREEFLHLLRAFGIEVVVDVRRFPTSQRFPHFVQENFRAFLEEAGIAYVHLGRELGGYRPGGYEAFMETRLFQEGILRLEALAREKKVVVVCSERFPWRCHRRFIARALQSRSWEVVHLIEPGRVWRPGTHV